MAAAVPPWRWCDRGGGGVAIVQGPPLPILADQGQQVGEAPGNVDLIGDGFALAVRGRAPPDSGLVVHKLKDAALVIVGSPRDLRRQGTPRDAAAPAERECIHFVLPRTGQVAPWPLTIDGQVVERTLPGAIRCADGSWGR